MTGRPAGYEREEARNAAVRATLEPLAPGERPRAVTVAAVVAATLGLANLVLLLAGWEVSGSDPPTPGVLGFALAMFAGSLFMWRGRYWAVLAFQMLLGLATIFAMLSLLVASNLAAVLVCLAVMTGAGTLFWFLVRPMARLQMRERPPAPEPP